MAGRHCGGAWAVGVASVLNGFYIAWCVRQIFPFALSGVVTGAGRLVVPAVMMGSIVYSLVQLLPVTWWALVLEMAAGAVVYAGAVVLVNGRGIVQEISTLLQRERPA
jgi:hypothetical protein